MDLKVLTAVFFTLAVIIVGTNTGMIDGSMLEDLQDEGISGFIDGIFSGFDSRPEPNISVQMEVSYSGEAELEVRNADVRISNLTQYKSLGSDDIPITFKKVKGDASFDNNTSVEGKAEWLLLSEESYYNKSIDLDYSGDARWVEMSGQEKIPVKLDNVTVDLVSGPASGTYTNSNLTVDSFSGNVTVYPGNSSMSLRGEVHKLGVGELEIGP